MNRQEVDHLLTFASSFDRRRIDEADVAAWFELLGDLEYADAYEAVSRHYARSEKRLYPADVRQGVASLRARRLAQHVEPPPDVDPDDVGEYLEALAGQRAALAEGAAPVAELPAADPPEEFTDREARPTEYRNALAVRCPWCAAARGEPCTNRGRALTQSPYHPSRLDAARQQESA